MKKILSFYLLTVTLNSIAQNFDFKKNGYNWPNASPDISMITDMFSNEDFVIIDEKVNINLADAREQTITKNCVVKINTNAGVAKLSSISLPESFDVAADKYLEQQGRASYTKSPFIYRFIIDYFSARVLKKDKSIIDIPLNVKATNVYWKGDEGYHMQDFNYLFKVDGLEIGDIVEYNYKIKFLGRYGSNMFYLNSEMPKQNTLYEVKYYLVPRLENWDVLCNVNGIDSMLTKTQKEGTQLRNLQIYSYKAKNLKGINYPINTCAGKILPYFFLDFNFVYAIPNQFSVYVSRGPKFEWNLLSTVFKEKPNYDSQHASGRKFLSKIPYDETANNPAPFISKFCDTLNTLKWVSAESMNYSGNAQYSVNSGGWLEKGKLMEEFTHDLYWQLLDEKKFEKYIVDVQDRRLGDHKMEFRSAKKYEREFFGIRNGKSILFVVPRDNGLKYYADELPFYYENTRAGLVNFDESWAGGTKILAPKLIAFIQTASSTENENVRSENGEFNVNLDSNLIHSNCKVSLNGQFSTVVRPIYLKDVIDSTINSVYFKKATDKPFSSNVLIKSGSQGKVFPFKHTFLCSENIQINNSKELSLKNWFSFTMNMAMIHEFPNFDYYFDFRYSDVYNYMIKFNKATEVANLSDFNHSISNPYFELVSSLTKQTDSNYLLSVMVKVKQPALLVKDGQLLLDFVKELDALNNLSMKLN